MTIASWQDFAHGLEIGLVVGATAVGTYVSNRLLSQARKNACFSERRQTARDHALREMAREGRASR